MSRIGKQPITVPPKVKLELKGGRLHAEGPKGKLEMVLPPRTNASVSAGILQVTRDGDDAQGRAMHGLARALAANLVKGVSEGYSKKLEINGVGFKASVTGNVCSLSLGYSHPINFNIPPQIKVTVEENTKLTVEGPSKQLVGQVAAELRSFYPPEPYKGKGVKYADEKIVRKEGKTVQ